MNFWAVELGGMSTISKNILTSRQLTNFSERQAEFKYISSISSSEIIEFNFIKLMSMNKFSNLQRKAKNVYFRGRGKTIKKTLIVFFSFSENGSNFFIFIVRVF